MFEDPPAKWDDLPEWLRGEIKGPLEVEPGEFVGMLDELTETEASPCLEASTTSLTAVWQPGYLRKRPLDFACPPRNGFACLAAPPPAAPAYYD
jgi:hypothetical protein